MRADFMTLRNRSYPGYGSGPPRYPGTFLLAFREALDELGWQAHRWLGDAVECVDSSGRDQIVGLENLFRRARRQERADWPDLIVDFLKTGQLGPIDDPPQDLNAVTNQLLVRLGQPLAARGDTPAVWSQPIPGTPLLINLVIDFPQSMFYVTEELIEQSGKPGAECLGQALANLQKQTPAESFALIHEESGLRQSSVGDAYDSSRVLLLDALLPEASTYGFLVALPGRDELLVMPVNSGALPFLPLLKVVAEKNHKSAPYPITDDVYWIKDGRWHVFGIEVRNDQANIQPPQEFLPLLAELIPGEPEEPQASDETEPPEGPLP
jgi:hypothetical protein